MRKLIAVPTIAYSQLKGLLKNPPQEVVAVIMNMGVLEAQELLKYNNHNRGPMPSRHKLIRRSMERREWVLTGQSMSVGKHNGRTVLIDGQHRATALIAAAEEVPGLRVPVLLTFGLPLSSQEFTDRSPQRQAAQDLVMTGQITDKSLASRTVANTKFCTTLLCGRHVSLPKGKDFNHWYPFFKNGVDWAVEAFATSDFKGQHITGTLAFAYPFFKNQIETFGSRLIAAGRIENGSPSYELKKYVSRLMADGGLPHGKDGLDLTKKILNAALAHIQGDKVKTLEGTDHGLQFFRRAWRRSDELHREVSESGLQSEVSPFTALSPLPARPEKVKIPGTR